MTFALITATRFEFSYDKSERQPLRSLNDDLRRQVSPTSRPVQSNEYDAQDSDAAAVNAQENYQTSSAIKYMQLIQIFLSFKNGTFLFIAW